MKLLLTLTFLFSSLIIFAQNNNKPPVADTSFPEGWDRKHKLREHVYEVLAWVHKKDKWKNEYKVCLTVFESTDSLGKPQYFFSEHYSDKKPFRKWSYGSIHYSSSGFSSDSGILIGFWDLHLEIFDHKPLPQELYSLIKKWKFTFYEDDWITLEAGLDSRLWEKFFGFKPNQEFIE